MATALPSPVKAGASAAGSTSTHNLTKTQIAQQKMEAAFNRLKGASAKVVERREAITSGLIATAEIQGATFAASFLSGWLHRRGKSMKVMGVDTRPVVATGMIIGGLAMEKGGDHLLALGNGVMASWTAEMAFDLGVKYATPKDAAAAPAPAVATAPAAPSTGDVPQVYYNGAVGDEDEVGRRPRGGGGGRQGRRVHVRRQDEGGEECETGDEGETGADGDEVGGLFPRDRIAAHYKTYRRKLAAAESAKNGKARAARLAEAENQMSLAFKVYRNAGKKAKAGIMLPREFAWFKTGRRPATDDGARPVATARPQFRPQVRPQADTSTFFEEEEDWDDDGDALDRAIEEMSEDEMASMAGVTLGEDGDIGEDEDGDEMGEADEDGIGEDDE